MTTLQRLRAPSTWLYVLAALLPFERIPALTVVGFHLRPSLLAAVMLVLTTVIVTPQAFISKTLTNVLLYAFLGACLISSIFSIHPERSLRVTIYTALAVLLALAVAATIKRISLRTLCLILLGSSMIVVFFSFYQFIGDLAGISTSATGLKTMYSSQVFGFPRVQAASLEPLYFANYLLLPLAILTAVGLTVGTSFIVLLLINTALLLTLSRGGVGVAAFVTAIFVAISISRKRFKDTSNIIGAGLGALVMVYLALTYLIPVLKPQTPTRSAVSVYTDQVTNYDTRNSINIDRSQTRALAIGDFKANPLLGSGPGTFGIYSVVNGSGYSADQIVNNEPAELLAETGAIGFSVFVAFLIALFARGIAALKFDRRTIHAAVLLGSIVYLGATIIQYWSFSTLYIIQVWFAIGLIIGLSQSKRTPDSAEQAIL